MTTDRTQDRHPDDLYPHERDDRAERDANSARDGDDDARYPIPDAYAVKDGVFAALRLYRIERAGETQTRIGIHMRLNPALVSWADVQEQCGGGEYVAQPVTPKGQVRGSYAMALAGPSVPAHEIKWPVHLLAPGASTGPVLQRSTVAPIDPTAAAVSVTSAAARLEMEQREHAARIERERREYEEERERRAQEREERLERMEREERERRERRDREDREERERRDKREREEREERDRRDREDRDERERRDKREREEREERERTRELERMALQERLAVERVKVESESGLALQKLKMEASTKQANDWASMLETLATKVVDKVAEKRPEVLAKVADGIYGDKARDAAREAVKTQLNEAMPGFVGSLTDAALDELASSPDKFAAILQRFAMSNPAAFADALRAALDASKPAG